MAIQPFATQIQAPQIQAPNPINQMGQLMGLRDAQQQNQFRGMQMQDLQQKQAQENSLQAFLNSGADLTTPEAQNQFFRGGAPGIAMLKSLREADEASVKLAGSRATTASAKQKFVTDAARDISSNPSNENITAYLQDMSLSKLFSPEEMAQHTANSQRVMAMPPEQRQAYLAQQGASTGELAPNIQVIEEVGPGGLPQQRVVAIDKFGGGVTTRAAFGEKPRAPGTTVNVGERAGVTAEAKILEEGLTKLGNVTGQLANVEAVRQAIPGARGMMGTGATALTATANFLKNRLGVQFDADALGALTDTAKIGSLLFQAVVDNLKSLDAAPSQSQQAAMQEAFGRISTDPDALYKVMDVYETAIRNKVASHNSRVDRASEGINKQFFRIDLPPKETPPEAPPKDAAKQPAEKKTKSGVAYTVEG